MNQHLIIIRGLLTVGLIWTASESAMAQPGRTTGDMDALLGPATAIDQGTASREEVRAALRPGANHELLARLTGTWDVTGHAGRDWDPVAQRAEIRPLFGGSWFELRVLEGSETTRIAHLGYDQYRNTFAMWEIGRGFTSPQARAGETRRDGRELHFWRDYTILRRGELTPLHERIVITFRDDGTVHWRSFERIGTDDERAQRDVVFEKTD